MISQETSQFRRKLLACAILATLGSGRALADIAGTVEGGSAGDPVRYDDSVTIAGDLVGGTIDAEGLSVLGVTRLDGDTRIASPDGSTEVTVNDGLVSVRVIDGGTENGLVSSLDSTVVSGGDATGSTTLTLDSTGASLGGAGAGNLAVAGSTVLEGDLEVQGVANFASGLNVLGGGASLTGDTLMQSGSGNAFGGVAEGYATLAVDGADGGVNGIESDEFGTSIAGGMGAIRLDDAGVAISGALAGSGSASLTSTDGSANASIEDGTAALSVQSGTGANGLFVNATDTTVTGGDDEAATSLLITGAGLEVAGTGAANLMVQGETATHGLLNQGGLASTGTASLTSTDGSANASVEDGTAALSVQSGTGANGIFVNGSDTTILGGDDDGTASLLVSGGGVQVAGSGGLAVDGATQLDGDLTVTGDTLMQSGSGNAYGGVAEGYATLAVDGAGGGVNGIESDETGTSLTGGMGAIRLDDAGVAVSGALAGTGSASLTSTDGSANASIEDGTAALSVQSGTGANGLFVNATDTTVTGGDDEAATSLLVTGAGLEVAGTGAANLMVQGETATHGLLNQGGLASTGTASITSTDGSAHAGIEDGAAALSVQSGAGANGLFVTGADTLIVGGDDEATTSLLITGGGLEVIGNGDSAGHLSVLGTTTTNGILNTGLLRSTGDTVLTSTDGTAEVLVADRAASLLVQGEDGQRYGIAVTHQGTVITGMGPTAIDSPDGTAGVIVSNGHVAMGVQNASGTTNGIVAGPTETVISGGTGTSFVTVNDAGVHITGTGPSRGDLHVQGTANVGSDLNVLGSANVRGDVNVGGALRVAPSRSVDFGGNRLQNVGEGVATTDAVNLGQLDEVQSEARRGVAIAAALDTLLPDPDKRFRLNLGGGYYNGESAIGLTGAGRINKDVAVYFGIGTDSGFEETAAKIGVSYQW